MSSTALQLRQDKLQNKRKRTPRRDFLMEIASWQPNVFYRVGDLISRFPDTDRIAGVVPYSEYHEQANPAYVEGLSYDPNQGFFDNFLELWKKIDVTNMINFFMSENCDYGDVVSKGKNIYLSTFVVNGDQDVMYCFGVKDECIRILNSSMISDHSENIYESLGVSHSFKVFYSRFIANCSDIYFSVNLQGCTHCALCSGLENKSYCYKNVQYSKEEYHALLTQLLAQKDRFGSIHSSLLAHDSQNVGSDDSQGLFLVESRDLANAYFAYRIQGGRNIVNVGGFEGAKNIYDVVDGGGPSLEDIYAVNGIAINSSHCYLSCHVPDCVNVYYSYYLESCSYCLGCIGLKNKSYCILNKQYTKEERHQKVNEIFSQMEIDGMLGQFFPGSINPFYFNDTVASLVGDFTKEEVTAKGYLRRDEEIAVDVPEWMDVVGITDLDQYEGYDDTGNWMIDPSILKKVIRDEQGNVYRVIKMEYDFLMKYGLPLPRKHWLERLKDHFRAS